MKHSLLITFIALTCALSVLHVNAQNGSECYKPLAGLGKTVSSVQSGVACVACNFLTNPENLVNADKNDFATYNTGVALLAGNGVSVTDAILTYPAGWHAGYVFDLGSASLSAAVLATFTIETYNNGVLQESKTSATGLSVSLLGGSAGKVYLNFATTQAFDEVRFVFNSVAGAITTLRIYYAMAFDPLCGTSFTAGTCYKQLAGPSTDVSFNGGLLNALVTLTNPGNINDGNKTTAATVNVPVATPILSAPVYVGVRDRELIYPAGSKAGFSIGYAGSLLTASVLNSLSIQTRLNGVIQETVNLGSGSGVTIGALTAGAVNEKEVSITTTLAFNEVRLILDNTLGVNVGAIDIYYAFASGSSCGTCRQVLTSSQASPYTGAIQASRTGIFGTVCIGQSMSGTANVVDASLTNFATYTPAILSVGCGGRISVTNGAGGNYPAGTFAGFALSRQSTLLDLNILNAITINVYSSGTLVQSSSGSGLLSAGLLNPVTGVATIGFKPTVGFNEIQIVFDAGLISASLGGTYNIYYAYVVRDDDGDKVADCIESCGTGNDAIDTDGDGIPDACDACGTTGGKSAVLDTDGDGVPNSCDVDSDNDGIPDSIEDVNSDGDYTNDDTDGDGIPNYLDLDSDNDGIPDLYESGIAVTTVAALDADNNGVIDASVAKGTNGFADIIESADNSSATINYTLANKDGDSASDYIDLDSDNDGINDIRENGRAGISDTNADGMADLGDTDNDGIMNSVDGNITRGANAVSFKDTDGDTVPDSRDLDSDNDGINDISESGFSAPDINGDGMVDGADTDGDGIRDAVDGSAAYGDAADPAIADTDGDGVPDFRDLDSDNDTISDLIEGGQPGIDSDDDGVADGADIDGDGIIDDMDGNTAAYGDANDAAPKNTDGDGLPNYRDPDSNNDGVFDITANGQGSLDLDNDGVIDTVSDPDGDGIMNAGVLDSKPAAFGGLGRLSTLPVTLENFSAVLANDNLVRIQWNSRSEQNIRGYITERSADGQHFSAFGNEVPAMNTNSLTSYQAQDASPLAGTSYYRLKILENDGSYRFSSIARINRGAAADLSKVQPSPIVRGSQLQLYLSSKVRAGDMISIYDAAGQLRRTLTATGSAIIHISTDMFTPGIYLIRITSQSDAGPALRFVVR